MKEQYSENEDTLYCAIIDIFNSMYSVNGKGVDIEIAKCYRVGPFNRNRNKPVIMELKYEVNIEFLLKHRRELPNGIHIKEDFPTEIDSRRLTLRPKLREANKHEEFRGKCKLKYDKLIIQGNSYSTEQLHRLPEVLKPEKIATKRDEHCTAYCGELSKLSNFHDSPFTYNSVDYANSEQAIQSYKAKLFNDEKNLCTDYVYF